MRKILFLLWGVDAPGAEVLADDRRMSSIKKLFVVKNVVIKTIQHIQSSIIAQPLANPEAKTIHELIPVVIAGIGAAVDDPPPDLVLVLLKLALDIVGVVEVG